MQQYAKALPPLLFAASLMLLGWFVFNEDEAASDTVARQQVNVLTEQVNSLPRYAAPVGLPPDEHWIRERVINLPEDGGMWHTVLILDGGPASQRLAAEFNATPRLQSLATQTKFYQYSPDHWWVQKHRAAFQPPLVLVQRPSLAGGGTNDYVRVYEQWGNGLPLNGELLADDIAKMIAGDCAANGRPCPGPSPAPVPTPQPLPTPPATPLVPLAPEEPKPPEDDGLGLVFYLLTAAAGLGGGYLGIKRELAG